MSKKIGLVGLLLALNVVNAGNESGHGGDPFLLEFYHRASFVLRELKGKKPVEPKLIQIFEEAVNELSVKMTNETLPYTGWVVDDPSRPGKKMVLLDRKKYLESFGRRFEIDINLFVAHEVWETKGYDIDKEITSHLRFSENAFVDWYRENFSTTPPSDRRSDPLCFFDRDQEIKITIDVWGGEQPGQLDVKFLGNENEVALISKGASLAHPGTHEIVLKHTANNVGKVGVELLVPTTKVTKYYELEFRPKLSSCSKGGHFEVRYSY